MVSLLVETIDNKTPLLYVFDGFSDRYWATRIREQRAHGAVSNSIGRFCSVAGLENSII